MAILQSNLSEEILSRQERAVIRGIYHAAQINEALVAVIKINESLLKTSVDKQCPQCLPEYKTQYLLMTNYLSSKIQAVLTSTKVPAPNDKQTSQSPESE